MKKNIINFKKMNGLVPVIIQDKISKEIYMLGYMNRAALKKTQETGMVYFWSRSRNVSWMKGETSGNQLWVKTILTDCDNDTLLVLVSLIGKNVCHTGNRTCFYTKLSI